MAASEHPHLGTDPKSGNFMVSVIRERSGAPPDAHPKAPIGTWPIIRTITEVLPQPSTIDRWMALLSLCSDCFSSWLGVLKRSAPFVLVRPAALVEEPRSISLTNRFYTKMSDAPSFRESLKPTARDRHLSCFKSGIRTGISHPALNYDNRSHLTIFGADTRLFNRWRFPL